MKFENIDKKPDKINGIHLFSKPQKTCPVEYFKIHNNFSELKNESDKRAARINLGILWEAIEGDILENDDLQNALSIYLRKVEAAILNEEDIPTSNRESITYKKTDSNFQTNSNVYKTFSLIDKNILSNGQVAWFRMAYCPPNSSSNLNGSISFQYCLNNSLTEPSETDWKNIQNLNNIDSSKLLYKTNIVNNVTTSTNGYVLDARIGKSLNDKITSLNSTLDSKINGVNSTLGKKINDNTQEILYTQEQIDRVEESINQRITNLGSVYSVQGSVSDLNALLKLSSAKKGYTYNIESKFYLNGKYYEAGTNVVCIKDFSSASDNKASCWDPLGGTFNASLYLEKDKAAIANKSDITSGIDRKEDITYTERGKQYISGSALGSVLPFKLISKTTLDNGDIAWYRLAFSYPTGSSNPAHKLLLQTATTNKASQPVESDWETINYINNISLSSLLSSSDIANNLTTTESGKVLDARQGKVLADLIELEKQTVATEIQTKVPIKNNSSESKVLDNSDGFYFTDKSGNIIAKILSDGIHAVALYDKDGNELGNADISIESIKDKKNPDGFYFTDFTGNVIAKITKDGLQAIKFLDKDGNELGSTEVQGENGTLPMILNNNLTNSPRKVHPLFGKDIYSFGDSLCKGTWEKMLADITGANFNKEANDLTSWGGSHTGDEGGPLYNEEGYGKNGDRPGGLRRAKNFVLMPKETYGNKDVIFFENVHDGVSESEDISKFMPFMWTRYAIYEGQEFYDTNVAGRYFEENRSSVLQSVGFATPQVGTMVKMKVKAVTVPLVFSNGATASGSIKITINGSDFETEVTEGDSIEQVIDKISVWSFSDSTGWKNKKLNSTTINLQYVGGNSSSEDDVITFDGQGTGVIATVNSKTESISYRTHAFLSLDISEWDSPEAWSYYAYHSRCYSQWKGVIEYIQKNCPETKMYMLLFPNSIYKKSYARPDGSFDVEAFYASTPWQQHIDNRRCLINIADYYNIPIIDLEKEVNVMCNWETYFPENNVHMKNILYQRFAEIIASKIY